VTAPDRPLILAVEDEALNAALLRAILEPSGVDLHVAASLAEARAWLASHSPALVMLDRQLPDGDGLELVGFLRASAQHRGVRIVVVSASVLPADMADAEAAGVDGFLAKPLGVRALRDEVARQLAMADRAGS
jgi:CheY-like chemotaxis protein